MPVFSTWRGACCVFGVVRLSDYPPEFKTRLAEFYPPPSDPLTSRANLVLAAGQFQRAKVEARTFLHMLGLDIKKPLLIYSFFP
jgi:hypothetical protein